MNRRDFLKNALVCAAAAPLSNLASAAVAAGGKSDSEIKAETVDSMEKYCNYWKGRRTELDASIDRFRKKDHDFIILDEQGKPLANTDIEVRQTSTDFTWGCAGLSLGQLGEKNAAYEARLSEFFNMVTTTFCAGVMVPQENRYRFALDSEEIWRRPPSDRVFEFTQKHGMRFKGQPLICDRWHPKWAMKQTKAEAERFYQDYFKRVAERYGKKAWAFDVVNEAFCTRRRTPGFPLYGGNDQLPFVDWAFAEAAKHFPRECKMTINMGIEATDWDNQGEKYYDLCKRILDAGIRLDGIGFQFHLFKKHQLARLIAFEHWHPDMLAQFYNRLKEMGKRVYINEITIPSTLLPGTEGEEIQAVVAENLYRFWFAQPAIHGVTWWNLMDGAAWSNEDSVKGALLNDFAQEKPVYSALRKLIAKEWKTMFKGKTDAAGHIRFRGFSGDYAVLFLNKAGTSLITQKFPAPAAGGSVMPK